MSQYDDFGDFDSPDPLVRYNAHQAAKGRPQMPDPDLVRKAQKEGTLGSAPTENVGRAGRTPCTCGGQGVCLRCNLDELERMLP